MEQGKRRFFIALLPPEEVQQVANKIKDHFAEVYQSKAAKKSPPHITLQPPFDWEWKNLNQLSQTLQEFSQHYSEIPVTLQGFAAFKPRVIYINVLRTPELLEVQKALSDHLATTLDIIHKVSQNRPFKPHITVAFRDLKKSAFYQAWKEYKEQSLHFHFKVSQITLLLHNGRNWESFQSFNLQSS